MLRYAPRSHQWEGLRDADLRGHGEAAHAAAHSGEGGVVYSDGFEGAHDHGGHEGGPGRRVVGQNVLS